MTFSFIQLPVVRTSKIVAVTGLALALAACQSIPKANPDKVVAHPQISPDERFPNASGNTTSNGNLPSIASQRWQDYYSDTNLKTLIAMGLENNKDINATILAVQQARAQYQIADIKDIPTIGASASASRGATDARDRNPSNSFNVGLALSSYELDFWGRIASLKDAALQTYLATGAAKDAAQISLISSIAQSYVAYSYNLAQLKWAQQTLAARQQSLRINNARFQAGLDSQLTVVQAQSSVEAANAAIATSTTALMQSANALRYLVGKPFDPRLLPPAEIRSVTNSTVFNAGLPSDLLNYRPDIRQAEYNLKAAGANINAARAAFYPTISLSGNVGTASGSLSDLFKSGSFAWGFGPSVSLPIFDAGARRANYEVSQIAQQQALNSYEKSIQTAFKEVSDVFAVRANLEAQRRAYTNMKAASDTNYKIADARFKAGLDNYLNVLTAQTNQYSSQQALLSVEQQQLNSQVQLYQVLGGGANFNVPLDTPVERHENLSDKIHRVANNLQQKVQN